MMALLNNFSIIILTLIPFYACANDKDQMEYLSEVSFGWVKQPDGTYIRKQSSSSSSSFSGDSGYRGGLGSSEFSGSDVVTGGGRWVWSNANNKWEWEEESSGGGQEVVNDKVDTDSGSNEWNGWILLSNGTWARKPSSGLRNGGQEVSRLITGGQRGELGDDKSSYNVWVTMSDGTIENRASSWSSWSSTSHDNVHGGGTRHNNLYEYYTFNLLRFR